jgi:hypothetical protein
MKADRGVNHESKEKSAPQRDDFYPLFPLTLPSVFNNINAR